MLKGRDGEIAPGLRFLLTPGHTDGSICVIARVPEGRMVIAGDTVGPLPSYFEHMKLPKGFPNRDDLMESWGRIHIERPDIIVPGHNPPVIPSYSPLAIRGVEQIGTLGVRVPMAIARCPLPSGETIRYTTWRLGDAEGG